LDWLGFKTDPGVAPWLSYYPGWLYAAPPVGYEARQILIDVSLEVELEIMYEGIRCLSSERMRDFVALELVSSPAKYQTVASNIYSRKRATF
jgi:hypothetical protein